MQEHYGGNFPKLRDIGTNYMETCKSYTRTLFREPGEKFYGGSVLLRKDVTEGGEGWRRVERTPYYLEIFLQWRKIVEIVKIGK